MTTTGLEIFDKTLQTTHIWLNEIGERIGPDKHRCYEALRAVLQTLRDRLPVTEAAQLSAELPLLVRGIFYEGYRPSTQPVKLGTQDEFVTKVAERLGQIRPMNPRDATKAVFEVLERHVSAGEIDEVRQALPRDIRVLFPGGAKGPAATAAE